MPSRCRDQGAGQPLGLGGGARIGKERELQGVESFGRFAAEGLLQVSDQVAIAGAKAFMRPLVNRPKADFRGGVCRASARQATIGSGWYRLVEQTP